MDLFPPEILVNTLETLVLRHHYSISGRWGCMFYEIDGLRVLPYAIFCLVLPF